MNQSLHECFEKAARPKVLGAKDSKWPVVQDVEEAVGDAQVRQVIRGQVFNSQTMVTIVVTDHGIHVFQKSAFGFKKYGKGEEYFPYSQITGVTTSFHPTYRNCVEFTRASNVDKYGYMEKDDFAKFVSLVQDKIFGDRVPQEPKSESNLDVDPLDRLTKLKSLVESGVISEEEFEQKKAKLLDEI